MVWAPTLLQFFNDSNISTTSSPILGRYDPDKPTFLKTDWSTEGMVWILTQPANDEEPQAVIKQRLTNGTCLFDLSRNGTRLQPTAFGSRYCTVMEEKYYSFMGAGLLRKTALFYGEHF